MSGASNQLSPAEPLLTADEAARFLHVPRSTLYELVRSRGLPHHTARGRGRAADPGAVGPHARGLPERADCGCEQVAILPGVPLRKRPLPGVRAMGAPLDERHRQTRRRNHFRQRGQIEDRARVCWRGLGIVVERAERLSPQHVMRRSHFDDGCRERARIDAALHDIAGAAATLHRADPAANIEERAKKILER